MSEDPNDNHEKPLKQKVVRAAKFSLMGAGVIYLVLLAIGILLPNTTTQIATTDKSGISDTSNFEGIVDIYHCGPSGTTESEFCPDGQKLITQIHDKNLIVERGHTCMADRIAGHSGIVCNAFNYIALGTSTTDPADGDTALGAENCGGSYARVQDTDATYTNGSPDSYLVSSTFTGFTCAITELGLFDASTTGNIQSHIEISVVNLGASDSFTVNWTQNIA